MPRFTFQLQSLLGHRERVEQERQRDAAVVRADLVAAQADLRRLELDVEQALADLRANRLTGTLDLSFLAAHRRFILAAQRQGAALALRVGEAQAKVDAAQQRLNAAAKDRKAIETLRDQQQARWADEQARKELAAGDEMAMQMVAADAVEAPDREGGR